MLFNRGNNYNTLFFNPIWDRYIKILNIYLYIYIVGVMPRDNGDNIENIGITENREGL